MKLSIIIPAHNEEYRLSPVLSSYAAFFEEKMNGEAQIILVANNCVDATVDLAKGIANKSSNVSVIDESRQIGKGGAIIAGVKIARGEYIGFVDADGATSAGEFYRLYRRVLGHDCIIASRWMKQSKLFIQQKMSRRISSRVFNFFTRTLLGLNYTDTQCGAKILKKEAWKSILPDIGITRFAFDVDLLFKLKRCGYEVIEEPTTWTDVSGSKVKLFTSSFNMFCAIVRMRLLYSPFKFVVVIYDKLLSGIVEKLRRDELFCHVLMLFAASLIVNGCTAGYQMVVSRALPKAEYTLLAAFLAIYMIISLPLGSLNTAIVHYTKLLLEHGREGAIKRLIFKWITIAAIPSAIIAVMCVFNARAISAYFHLNRIAPIVVFGMALPVVFINPVLGGAIGGLQRFGWLSISFIVGAFARVIFGAICVFAFYPACGWALLGHFGSISCSVLIVFCVLFFTTRKLRSDSSPLPSLKLYLVKSFFIQISFAILMTGDVVMIRHYLPQEIEFAFAGTLGRIVVFLTGAIAIAMFPKVVSNQTFTREHRRIYIKAMIYTFLFAMGAIFLCGFFPELLQRFLFRIVEPSENLIRLTRLMLLAMTVITFLKINMNLLIAQRRFGLASVIIIAALAYMGGVYHMHDSAQTVVILCIIASVCALLITTVGILFGTTVKEKVS